jgi:hypothetical protein
MQTALAIPNIPVGEIRTIGPYGPKYEVVQLLRPIDSYDWMVEMLLVETGEYAEYPLSDIIEDPKAD